MTTFPTLTGQEFERTKTPIFKTISKQSVSGYESRTPLMSYPLWKFKLSFSVIRENSTLTELQSLMGFYLNTQGSYANFKYKDPYDYIVTNQTIGTGDGTTKSFQLIRSFGGFIDRVQSVDTLHVYLDAVETSSFTESNGLITFTTAPTAGQVITYSAHFYFVCRFTTDQNDFINFMNGRWNSKLEFISVKL